MNPSVITHEDSRLMIVSSSSEESVVMILSSSISEKSIATMNPNVVTQEEDPSLMIVSSSSEERFGQVNLEDSLSSLSLFSGAEKKSRTPKHDYLDGIPTLHSILCQDEYSIERNRTCLSPIHSVVSRSRSSTILPDLSNRNNDEFAAASISVEKNQAPLPNAFNKKLYLPKVHELPTRSGAQALSAFCYHEDEMIKSLHNLLSSLKNCPSDDSIIENPSGLAITLFDYQLKGLSWLLWRESESPPGGLMADDMGLGKTIQMISLILKSKEISQNGGRLLPRPLICNNLSMMLLTCLQIQGGTLIVVPSSVLGQWNSEINKRVKPYYLSVYLYHGQSRMTSANTLARYDVVLTTYGIVQKASEVDPMKRITWERIILDEAHMIRNHRSQTAKSVFTLKGLKKWALTGTPIQNKSQDYYGIMKFLQLKPFNDWAVWKKFVDNKHDSGFQRLRIISKAIMLRRTKEQIKNAGVISEISEKYMENLLIDFDKEEFVLYDKLSHFSKALLAQFIQEHARKEMGIERKWNRMQSEPVEDNLDIVRWRKNFESIGEVKTLQILVLLLRLRQLCCHPSLTRATLLNSDFETNAIDGSSGNDSEEGTATMSNNFFGHDVILDNGSPLFDESRASSKIDAVIGLLRRIFQHSKTDKVIIVSQWTSFLSLIEKFISEHLGMKCLSFNGKIPVTKRQPIVDKFNSPSLIRRILLLSLTAGGIGLNLVGANHIIFVDLHWNPQLENQAADRIYRFGQMKDVYVYKILCKCTIEERIFRLQQSKIAIANDILNGFTVGKLASKLSINDLKLLFGVEG